MSTENLRNDSGIEKIRQLLSEVKNPATGKSLTAEQRWLSMGWQEDQLHLRYQRDEINVTQKRDIEQQILALLGSLVPVEQIRVLTVSEKSQEVVNRLQKTQEQELQTAASTAPAQIKAGHGTPGANKKRVPGIKKLIAVGSGKGGVGKSTFAVNLAATLKNQGLQVGLLDADVYGPSLIQLLNLSKEKPYTNDQKKILPLTSKDGLKVISFGSFVDPASPVIWRGPMLGGVLNQFLFDVDWSGIDVLIVDLPPGTGDIQLSMVQNTILDGVIIVSTPQEVALLDAVKGLEMFRKLNIPILGMVENMSSFICGSCDQEHFIFDQGGVEKRARTLQVPFLGAIPLEMKLRVCSDEGTPFMFQTAYAKTKSFQAYEQIVGRLEEQLARL